MNINKKSVICSALIILMNFQSAGANDWLDKLSTTSFVYPMLLQSVFFAGIFLGKILGSCEDNQRKKENETIASNTAKRIFKEEFAPFQQKMESDNQETKNKLNVLEEKFNYISTDIKPILEYVHASDSTWPETVKGLTEAIRLLHLESLPQLETRLNDVINKKFAAIDTKLNSLEINERLKTLNNELLHRDKELEVKMSTFLLQHNIAASNAHKAANDALKQIQELRDQRSPQFIGISPFITNSERKNHLDQLASSAKNNVGVD